jgi:hypothetical protein
MRIQSMRSKISAYLVLILIFAVLAPALTVNAIAPAIAISKVFDENTFNASNIQVNTSASLDPAKGVLLPNSSNTYGSAFTKYPVTLSSNKSFSAYAQVTSKSSSSYGGTINRDGGYAFVIQTNGNTTGSSTNTSYGYGNNYDSIAVVIDVENNKIKILKNINPSGTNTYTEVPVNLSHLYTASSVEETRHLWVDYDGTNLNVRLANSNSRPSSPDLTFAIDLSDNVLNSNTVYAGFTAATHLEFSGTMGYHNLNKFYFDSGTTPITPSSVAYVQAPAVVKAVSVPSDGAYLEEDNLDFSVQFSDAISVTGTSLLPIMIGSNLVYASYVSGSGSNTLLYRYEVQASDLDLDGVSVGASISLNGGTLIDQNLQNAALTLNNIGNTTEVNVGDSIEPTVTTTAVTGVTTTTATAGGDVTANGGDAVTVHGVVYSTNSNPTLSDSVLIVAGTTGSYTAALSGLTPETTYYVKAYATNGVGTSYGSIESFTTNAVAVVAVEPTVTTTAVTAVSTTTASAGGTVTSDGGDLVTVHGVVYSTDPNPTLSDSVLIVAGTTGIYTAELTALTPETTYYVKAYATNGVGTSYGSIESFTTNAVAMVALEPTVTTTVVTGVSTTTASAGGTVTSDGGDLVTVHGVVYSTDPNPTLSDTVLIVAGTTGSYTAELSGLTPETTYYVKAYATNGVGTSYGSIESFTTNIITVTPTDPGTDTPTVTPTPGSTATPAMPATPATPATPEPNIFKSDIVDFLKVITNIQSLVAKANNSTIKVELADVNGHWAEKTVETFIKLGVIQGYGNTKFNPDGNITRAEFATILTKVFSMETGNKSIKLRDLETHWAKSAIEKLTSLGVSGGYGDGTFRPDRTISREEMIIIISRIVNLAPASEGVNIRTFTDIDDSYAKDALNDAVKAGVISGKGNNKIEPKSKATRAEALTIVLNTLNLNPQLKTILDQLK